VFTNLKWLLVIIIIHISNCDNLTLVIFVRPLCDKNYNCRFYSFHDHVYTSHWHCSPLLFHEWLLFGKIWKSTAHIVRQVQKHMLVADSSTDQCGANEVMMLNRTDSKKDKTKTFHHAFDDGWCCKIIWWFTTTAQK
jgi:hypothetical protein